MFTSILGTKGMERSTVVCTAPSTGWKKDGQPVPESNLALDSYTGLPQPAHLYVPLRFSCIGIRRFNTCRVTLGQSKSSFWGAKATCVAKAMLSLDHASEQMYSQGPTGFVVQMTSTCRATSLHDIACKLVMQSEHACACYSCKQHVDGQCLGAAPR